MHWTRSRSIAVLALGVVSACGDTPRTGAGRAVASGTEATARDESVAATDPIVQGRYLVEGLLRCFICHSPRDWAQPGAPPVAGMEGVGQVWRDDGTSRLVAANLTPDPEVGIGRWTDEQLINAIREGVSPGGRRLHGAMPTFRHLTDADAAAVVAYLRSRSPVRNALPLTLLSEEEQADVDARRRRPLRPLVLTHGDPIERGRALVVLGECAGCHTSWHSPRMPGLLGGGNLIHSGERQAFSSNLTPHASGMRYDDEGFIHVMGTGRNGVLSPLMPWAVYRNLSDADLRSINAFLRTMHPVAHHVGNAGRPTRCPVCGQVHPLGDLNQLEQPAAVALDPRDHEHYVGTYLSDEYGFMIRVTRTGDRLFAQWDDGPRAELVPLSDSRFLEAGGVAPLRFVRDGSGRATQIVSEEVEELVLQRVR